MLIHPLAERLRALGLAAMADTFLQMQLDPAAAELSREDWLGLLLEREVTARDNKRYRILFSDNITDRMLGNRGLFEHMLNRLKLKRGEVSADGAVSVNLTSCTGMCDQGPALLVNNRPVTRLTARRVWRRPQAGAAAGGDGRRYRYRNADAASRRRGDAVRSAAGANGVAAPASALRLF